MLNDGRPFRTGDARGLGLVGHGLQDAVASGEIVRLVRGVYVDALVEVTLAVRCTAVRLVAPAGAVIGDRTAAWVYGIDLTEFGQTPGARPIDLVVAPERTPPRRPGLHPRQAELPAEDVVEIDGLLLTSPVRTAVDLARLATEGWGLAAADAFVRTQLATQDEMLELLGRYPGERGVAIARASVEWADAGAESVMESWSRWRVLVVGLPRPRTQIDLELGGRTVWLDFGYDEYRVGVEYDGRDYHSAEVGGHDWGRRRRIAYADWSCVVLMTSEVLGNRPTAALAVAEVLMARGWRPDDALSRRLEALARKVRWNP